MNIFQRALTSITRRKLKSLILLLIVIILGNIILSTLLIVQSVDGTRQSILRELPPVVSLEIDYTKLDELYKEQGQFDKPIEIPWLTFDDLDRIEADAGSYIKIVDYSAYAGIETKSLEPYTIMDGGYVRGPGETNYFTLQGVSAPIFAMLEVGDAEIVEGRSFTQEELDNGSPVLLIGEGLAEKNNLMVGDTVLIESLFTDYTEEGNQVIFNTIELEFKLIGILKFKALPQSEGKGGFSEHDYLLEERNRTLFTGNRFVEKYSRESMDVWRSYYEEKYGETWEDYYEDNPLAGRPITFILNSSEDVGSFVQSAQAALNNEYYYFATQEDNYKKVAAPLESMRKILTYAFYITVGSAIIVLTLVLFGFMRDRQKEIGIYLALGEKKSKITVQMIIENVAVGFLGALLALASGTFVASYISDMLIAAPQLDPQQGVILPVYPSNNYLANFDYESILQSYQVGFSATAVIAFIITILATIVVAQLIASIYILRSDPKKIMM